MRRRSGAGSERDVSSMLRSMAWWGGLQRQKDCADAVKSPYTILMRSLLELQTSRGFAPLATFSAVFNVCPDC